MTDGACLRQTWYTALTEAEAHFRRLLTSSGSTDWKRVPTTNPSTAKGKARAAASAPELSDVVVHRKPGTKSSDGDVFRLVLDVPTPAAATTTTGEQQQQQQNISLEPWKAVLGTPELRQEWDPACENSHLLEVVDHTTRICKTNFTLGWPANPRDAVTISRSFHDATTVIDITTSLPRSPDEPAYLRPSPPYVRSNVTLFAWCIQYIPPPEPTDPTTKQRKPPTGRTRITCFWQHDLKYIFNFSSSLADQLCTMSLGLLKTVRQRRARVPVLTGWGNGVTIERVRYEIDREALTVDYAIIPEDGGGGAPADELHSIREAKRLARSIECVLPSSEGWDVQLSTKASSEEVERLPWTAHAIRTNEASNTDKIILRVSHAHLIDDHSILKVKLVIEVSGPSSGLRLNGLPHNIQDALLERDPAAYRVQQQMLQDMPSTSDLSFHSSTTASSTGSTLSATSSVPTLMNKPPTERSAAAEKSVLSRVRRNYIYFSSLLQEPEAKWRRTTEARGVSITQLDSIDPTLVVYRAEATFVSVGLWDLYAALSTAGARIFWDKQHADAVLLEDVNELTELWHLTTHPAWPVNGRDSVLLKTVYKSPTTIHVFSFSADDPHLFPTIPPVEPNVIRTQVDLQGWAIEALSPNTTSLTLLEQSDPKGWTTKTTIPTLMINALAGIGEFAIKCGGPPIVTRLSGAKANEMRYDHERGNFRVEYERRLGSSNGGESPQGSTASSPGVIECELRCDVDTWASSLDIVVDPPPQSMTCLRRHRLSAEGGGLWLTMTHDLGLVDVDERLQTIIRRGPGKEKGLVMVNGSKITVDVEELPEAEIKSLTKRKRIKPVRIPLDQPPVMGVIRRRNAEWSADAADESTADANATTTNSLSSWASAPRISSPLTRMLSYAVDQATLTTQQAVAAISPATAAGEAAGPSSSKPPMQYALDALGWVQDAHPGFGSDGWTLVSDKGMSTHRRLCPDISPSIPLNKGAKVIEGVSAEELAAVVTETECRRKWDAERFDSEVVLESFGAQCQTSFMVAKGGFFPFRDRGFYLASVMAKAHVSPAQSRRSSSVDADAQASRNAIYCVSASFSPDSVASFATEKYNPSALPIGRVFVDAWVLETLDPYTTENYAIPSTRCTRVVGVDYAGNIPAALNTLINATLPKSILALEAYIRSVSPIPFTRLPAAGLFIANKKPDDFSSTRGSTWKLRRRDDTRALVAAKYDVESRVYQSCVILLATAPVGRAASPSILDSTLKSKRSTVGLALASPTLASTPSLEVHSSESSTGESSSTLTTPTASPRARTVSATSLSLSSRGRSGSASAFTVRGEVRLSTDTLVAEFVVDSKLYPEGYQIGICTRQCDVGTPESLKFDEIRDVADATGGSSKMTLPIITSIHTMPPTPLHSSSGPSRQLVRMVLPTAQYKVSAIKDPLTGEMHAAPEKPDWLVVLETHGVVVTTQIRPRESQGTVTPNGDESGNVLPTIVTTVLVDGIEVTIVGEKESLTSLGRDELLDDRSSKMGILSRYPSDVESFLPEDLKTPVAVASNLLPSPVATINNAGSNETENVQQEDESGKSEMSENPSEPLPASIPGTPGEPSNALSNGRLLGFWSNPLARFTSTAIPITPSQNTDDSLSATIAPGSPSLSAQILKLPGTFDLETMASRKRFTLSTLLFVSLIAFLLGSLLRSLLSPADFIYVVTDIREAEAEAVEKGWREIRRLVEIKYLFGGWDFQVAVVRRT